MTTARRYGQSQDVELAQTTAAEADPLAELSAVYEEHIAFVWRVVGRLGVPAEAVADVAQDVFLVVQRRLPDYDGRASMRAWLAGICRGVVANERRSRARRRRRLELLPTPPSPDPRTHDRMEMGELVARGLAELVPQQREVLVLCDIEGVEPREVAEMIGVSRNTIYSRLRLGRRKMRACLVAWEAQG